MNSFLIIDGLLVVGSVVLVALIARAHWTQHKAAEVTRKYHNRLALSLNPAYRQKEEDDRAYELALRKQVLEERKFAFESWKDVHHVSPETYIVNTPVISSYAFPSLKRPDVTIQEAVQSATGVDTLPLAPTFAQIASQIAPGHLFLGQGQNGPIWGDVTDLLSTIIAGRPGTGKTTKLRDVCAQVLLIGGLPILFDPHGSIVDDLGTSFQCAESPQEIDTQSTWLDAQLERRLVLRRQGQREFQPLLLLVDEMPVISAMAESALPAIRRIVLEGRKVGMFALVSGQGVPASILGGTLVRDAMASRYVFCTTPQQARMAGIENETAKKMMAILEYAGPGKAILATSRSKPEIVAIPDTTINDIRLIVSPPGNNGNVVETVETALEADGNAETRFHETGPLSREDTGFSGNDVRETIRRLHKEGKPMREICKEVGMSGRKYNEFQQMFQHVLDEESEGT